MGKQELDNLVKIQKLKAEAASRKEFAGMLDSARSHLTDAQNESIDPDSQFDLAWRCAQARARCATPPRVPFRRSNYGFPDARSHFGYGQIRHTDLPESP
jgi:hypothetical protein